MEKLIKILKFLNLLDDTGTALSLTNIAMLALVAKMVLTSQADWTSVSVTIGAMANYMHKRTSYSGAPGETK